VQVLIEALSTEWLKSGALHFELLLIISEFQKDLLLLCTHINGNHVVQTFLTEFRSSEQPQDSEILGTQLYEQFTDFVFSACKTWPVEIGSNK
jgi:hypothetical protein